MSWHVIVIKVVVLKEGYESVVEEGTQWGSIVLKKQKKTWMTKLVNPLSPA